MSTTPSKNRTRATVEFDDMGRIYVKSPQLIRVLWERGLADQGVALTVDREKWEAELAKDPGVALGSCYVVINPPNAGCLCPINLRLGLDRPRRISGRLGSSAGQVVAPRKRITRKRGRK